MIYLPMSGKLLKWQANTTSKGTIIKIELSITDPYDLSYAIQSLSNLEQEQRARKKPAAEKPATTLLALPAPSKLLPSAPAGEGE